MIQKFLTTYLTFSQSSNKKSKKVFFIFKVTRKRESFNVFYQSLKKTVKTEEKSHIKPEQHLNPRRSICKCLLSLLLTFYSNSNGIQSINSVSLVLFRYY